jgi:hypothetical protein
MNSHVDVSSRQRGLTLTEALVALLLLSVLFIAFLAVFDASNRLAKSQGNIADATENLRFSVGSLVRLVRMAGTGGIPVVYPSDANTPPTLSPLAASGFDNVSAGVHTFGGRTALAGTDILRIRGVISGELYDIDGSIALATANQLVIDEDSPYTSGIQELRAPTVATGKPLLIGLQAPLDIAPQSVGGKREYSNYRIVTVTGEPTIDTTAGTMTIPYSDSTTHKTFNPSGAWVNFMDGLALSAGFIDDFIFFVALNNAGEPALYRFDGTGNAQELVPNIANFQVAWGCDTNRDLAVTDVGQAPGDDEWLNNVPGETFQPNAAGSGDQMAALRCIRVSVVARSQDPEMGWTETITLPENAPALTGDELRFRYRALAVQVLLRSHPPLV